jgi:hypothetical protein
MSQINGGYCSRCQAKFAPDQVVVVVRKGDKWFETDWVTVCAACAEPAEQARAKYKVMCEGCSQPMLTPRYPCAVRRWVSSWKNIGEHVCSKRCEQRYRRRLQRESRDETHCTVCGVGFRPKRADAKFCSNACRQRAYREVSADVERRLDTTAVT